MNKIYLSKIVLIFYIPLIGLLLLVNSTWLEPLLDLLLGVKWSLPIVNILHNNSKDLFLLLLISIYFEIAKSASNSKIKIGKDNIEISDSFSKILAKLDPRSLIEIVLESTLEKGNVSNLIDIILPEKNIYYDVRVKYTLKNHPANKDKYLLLYEIEFTSTVKEYILVIAQNTILQEKISNTCPKVCDVITIPAIGQGLSNYSELIKNLKISQISYNTSGGTKEYPVQIKIVKEGYKNYSRYLPGIALEDYNNIILAKANFAHTNGNMSTCLLVTPPMELNKSDHYIYWVSDRPMWIRQIEFDASAFEYEGRKDFNIQPLIINYDGNFSGFWAENKILLLVRNWIGKGHGAIFSWR